MIYKSKHSQNFTVVPNEILININNGLAIGILVYLLSRPREWKTHKQQLYKHFKEGRARIDGAFKLLEKKGYIRGQQIKGEDGRFSNFEWIVYDVPFHEIRLSENQLSENGQSKIHQLISKEIPNKDLINKEDKRTRKKFKPPTEKEVVEYFIMKGYTSEAGKKAFNYYDVADWKDGSGKQVKNWKQKMIAVWFKPENKANASNSSFNIEDYEQ